MSYHTSFTPAETYLCQLDALTTLGLPLVSVPDGVAASVELRSALRTLEEGLLRTKVALLKAVVKENTP